MRVDELAAMVGGIGIAPGANINYKSGHAIFEATTLTALAPNIAGKNVVNPCSLRPALFNNTAQEVAMLLLLRQPLQGLLSWCIT